MNLNSCLGGYVFLLDQTHLLLSLYKEPYFLGVLDWLAVLMSVVSKEKVHLPFPSPISTIQVLLY